MAKFLLFIKSLASPRNILPVIVIIAAVVGTFDLRLFGAAIRSDQVIMALLGFLAIDALIERIELLTSIETQVHNIAKGLVHTAKSSAFFMERNSSDLATIIRNAQSDISISGITLDTIVTMAQHDPVRERLRSGCKFRILAPDPDASSLIETAKYFASRPEFASGRIKNNLETLAIFFKQIPEASYEIRTIDRVLTTGQVIVDSKSPRGKMRIQHYLYWSGVKNAPLFELTSKDDTEWFSIYLRQFEIAWEHAKPYQLSEESFKKLFDTLPEHIR